MSNECPVLLQAYLNRNLANGHLTETSVYNYRADVMMFFKYLVMVRHEYSSSKGITNATVCKEISDDDIISVTKDDVWGYVLHLTNDRKLKAISVKRRITALSNFYKDLRDNEELIERLPTEGVKIDNKVKKTPVYLTQEEWERLIEVTAVNSSFKERDLCIILFLLNLGLRREEIVQLNVGDVKVSRSGSYVHIHGKGRKERNIPLNETCIEAYEHCVATRIHAATEKDSPALFISKKGYRMSASAVYRMIKKMALIANLDPNVTTHSLRHTFGTNSIRIGTINQVQKLMGHESIATTTIYTHISDEGLDEIIKNSPVNQQKQLDMFGPNEALKPESN